MQRKRQHNNLLQARLLPFGLLLPIIPLPTCLRIKLFKNRHMKAFRTQGDSFRWSYYYCINTNFNDNSSFYYSFHHAYLQALIAAQNHEHPFHAHANYLFITIALPHLHSYSRKTDPDTVFYVDLNCESIRRIL